MIQIGSVSPKTPQDRYLHALNGVVPDIDGNLTLEPSNYVLGTTFEDLDDDGDPDGMEIVMPPEPSGFYIYFTAPNGGQGTAAAQNTTPIGIDETHVIADEPWADGHLPTTASRAADVPAPPAPGVEALARAITGFEAGTYLATYAYISVLAALTPLAPTMSVVVAAGQGIRLGIPQQFPEHAVAIAIFLSAPNGTAATLTLQGYIDIISERPETIFLPGPWSSGRAAPIVNETVEPPPPAPEISKVPGPTQSQPGTYQAQITKVDHRGRETLASPRSRIITISPEEAAARVHIKVDFRDTSRDGSGRYNIYILHNDISYRWIRGNKTSPPVSVPAPRASAKRRRFRRAR